MIIVVVLEKRQAISMETKVVITKKLDSGEKMVNVPGTFNMNRSTVGTIISMKLEKPIAET